MAAYTTEQQAFIVRALAEYVPPETIVIEFGRHWKDTACTITDVLARLRRNLPAEWQEYFDKAREEFLDAPADNQKVRVAKLDRMASIAESRGAYPEAARYLEQIAKEKAGYYGGKSQDAKGAGGTTPEFKTVEVVHTIIDPVSQVPE